MLSDEKHHMLELYTRNNSNLKSIYVIIEGIRFLLYFKGNEAWSIHWPLLPAR